MDKGRDRYLKKRGGRFYYYRRVPAKVAHLDARGTVEEALGTDSLEIARKIRDSLAEADEAHWASLLEGRESDELRYEAAKARAKAMGISFRRLDDLVDNAPLEELVSRVSAVSGKTSADRRRSADALLGGAPAPVMKVSKALKVFLEKVAPAELAGKSPKQTEDYRKVKRRAVNNFIEVNGDVNFWSITREQAVAFYDWWADRIAGKHERSYSGNSANRDVGNMRKIWRELANREGRRDLQNPFDGLSFRDPKRLRKTPPPFPVKWIKEKLLRAEAYTATPEFPRRFNREAASIFLAVIETGARPSEICNLVAERIQLNHAIPHIVVDFDEARQIKTESSTRAIPLVGIALEVMKRNPGGFERYRDKETNFSNAMLKHLRRRSLLPSDGHVVYSARHAFEDRLKEAEVGDEMRRLLMGHAIERPEYGEGGSLEYRLKLLRRIELPFDPALLDYLDAA